MKKVITYGTYDLLHYGHIRLLERAKALGDYLIVGITADDFDKKRGKINVQQSLIERIEAVRQTGLADKIIVEEYEGQKIDDIKKYGVDIFTVGSDWLGKFDYLKEYCDVIYLDRTEGISSTDIRSSKRTLKMGIIGDLDLIGKVINEDKYVNGLNIISICTMNIKLKDLAHQNNIEVYSNYNDMLKNVEAVYIATSPELHFQYISTALKNNKHVLCETPMCLSKDECNKLYELASKNNLILMEALKTAYSTAFNRLILLAKMGQIGEIVSIDSTCTSMEEMLSFGPKKILSRQNSMCAWGPTAILPALMLLGTDFKKVDFITYYLDKKQNFDLFTNINLLYPTGIATVKIGKGVKSEGQLIISGTKGYIYVPAPWWKTEYFEVKSENENEKKRYFYQLDGEGIRYELVSFVRSVENDNNSSNINKEITLAISDIMERFAKKENLVELKK